MSDNQKQNQFKPVEEVAATPVAPAAPIVPSAPSAALNNEVMEILRILAGNEARKAAQETILANQEKARDIQRQRNSKEKSQDRLIKQARCKHLKGTGKGPKSPQIDYNVYHHTFISKDQWIKCNNCNMKWFPQDTPEFLYRPGRVKPIPNHTKQGWHDALNMMANSTNKPSSSEIPSSQVAMSPTGPGGLTEEAGYEAQ